MATTLVINPGSSSRKYALYDNGDLILDLRFEQTETGFEVCVKAVGLQQTCKAIDQHDFTSIFERVVDEVHSALQKKSVGKRIDCIAIKIVAPGTFFQRHTKIDNEYLRALKADVKVSPLYIPSIVREIEAAKEAFANTQIIAVSDSAFYSSMSKSARSYSIPIQDAREHDLYRFGYYGLSVASVVRRVHPLIGRDPARMIVCHIGGGASVTAVKDGVGIDTTMGFSPASGLPMGSRAGDLDSTALLELMRVKNMKVTDAEMYIHTQGGLEGLAGSSDIRELFARRAKHDQVATDALVSFSYHIQKAIAAQTVAIQGLDVLVFTATAAVRSAELRSLILSGLSHFGIELEDEKNQQMVSRDGIISKHSSKVKVLVMRTDEMGEMEQIARQYDH